MSYRPAANSLDRRSFVGSTAAYFVAAALAAACGDSATAPGNSSVTGGGTSSGGGTSGGGSQIGVTVSGNSISVNVVQAGIASAGQYVILLAVDAIVINIGTGYVALSKTCTHSSCGLARYNSSSALLECDCHGSRFRTTGAVAVGPAVTPLRSYAVTATSGVVTFTV